MTPRLRLQRWPWVAAIGVVLVALASLDPARAGRFLDCPFHWVTGLYCPGCGTLRAVHQGLSGHLLAALDLNALAVITLPLLLLLAVPLPGVRERWQPARLAHSVCFGRACVVAILAFWVVRNIPIWPLTVLAP